jgi:PAS domain S-box-containing protein
MRPRLRLALIGLAYWASHLTGYFFLSHVERISPVWPASGVGLAILLLSPREDLRRVLGLLGGVTLLSNWLLLRSLSVSAGFSLANLLELGLGALILRGAPQQPASFASVRDVLRLTFVAAAVTGAAALIGAGTSSLAYGAPFGRTYVTWWISDGLGILLLTPLFVSFARPVALLRQMRVVEAIAFALAWAFAASVAFLGTVPLGPLLPQPYMLLPLLTWSALRLGTRGATAALAALGAVAIGSAVTGSNAFDWGLDEFVDRLLTTQVFVAIAAVMSLLLAASATEAKLLERSARADAERRRAAEAEARSHAESLHRALEAAHMGTWEWDIASGRVRWSLGVERLFGLEPGRFAGTYEAYLELIHPEDRATMLTSIEAALAGKLDEFLVDHRVYWPDGSLHWLEGKGSVHRDGAGKPLRMTGTVVEISARKRVEEELSASEERLRNFVRHTPAAVAMFDNDMRYLYVADRWLSDYHLDGQNVLGRSHYEVFPDVPERWRAIHQSALAGTVERCDEDRFERADGSTDWLQWEVRPWRKAGGEIGGIIMFTHLITERKRAEEAQRRNEARFRTVIENASDMIVVLDRRGEILFQSPSSNRLLGRTPDELVGRNALEFTHPDDLPLAEQALARAAGPLDLPLTVKLRLRHADGSYRLMECVGREVPGEGPGGYIVINCRDITESTELQEKLRQTQKLEALGTLAGGIAHDFNNILGAMLAFTELARLDNPDNPPLNEHLREVTHAGKRATDLVRQILSFSRQQPHERKPMSLAPVIQEVLRMLRSTLPTTLEIDARLPETLPHVSVDATQMHQVVMNICTNAAQAMRGRGRLLLSLEVCEVEPGAPSPHPKLGPGAYLRLTIDDTGHGMDSVTLSRAFEPFFTTKGPGAGTGLGLAVAHGIVNEHDGAIGVASTPGLGTTVTIHLPIVRGSTPAPKRRVSEAPAAGHGERILFVDDEQTLCTAARLILSRAGYDPVVCRDSEEAWQRVKSEPDGFDLVVSDLTMPGMTGLDLAAKIHDIRPGLPIVLCSGHADGLTLQGLHDVGVRELIEKPFDYKVFTRTVAKIMEEGGAARASIASRPLTASSLPVR